MATFYPTHFPPEGHHYDHSGPDPESVKSVIKPFYFPLWLYRLWWLMIMVCFTACASVRAVAKYDSDIPTAEVVTKTAYLWGLVQPDDVQTGDACPYICMVTVKSTFGTVFISAVTLGIVVPVKFEYRCCSPEPAPAEI